MKPELEQNMGRNHEAELSALPSTLRWSKAFDISQWKQWLRAAQHHEAIVVASGGSYSAAVLLAQLHTRTTGKLALAVTPLEFISMGPLPGACVWLISAGGSNKDILATLDSALHKQFAALVVMCGDSCSLLVSRAMEIEKAEVLAFDVPTGPDGFLATNSLVAFFSLILRLHAEEPQPASDLWDSEPPAISPEDERLLEHDTLVVLYDGWMKAVATDLESRFSEAALGHVQMSDFRNFAHGRHYWLARRGQSSAVLAMVTPESRVLAQQTLAKLPSIIPRRLWDIQSEGPSGALEGLVRSILLARAAAGRIGVDAGRPGVPEFGRHIYELGPLRDHGKYDGVLREFCIERKTKSSIVQLLKLGQLDRWKAAFEKFCDSLENATFTGVVLDYDGTLVATKRRFEPVSRHVRSELARLMEEGMQLGIATGRGKSVWKELRSALPESQWDRVFVGYYNASVLRPLSADISDIASGTINAAIAECHRLLAANQEFCGGANLEVRPTQITVTSTECDEMDLWYLVSSLLERSQIDGIKVVRSSHSVDIIERTYSKCAVVAHVQQRAPKVGQVLKIGDRGRWPGNDADLLDMEFALSVDEVSDCLNTGWNLLGPALSGASGAARYLACLRSGRFHLEQLSR